MKQRKRKRNEAAQVVQKVVPGYVGKPKGKRQILWERGLHFDPLKIHPSLRLRSPPRNTLAPVAPAQPAPTLHTPAPAPTVATHLHPSAELHSLWLLRERHTVADEGIA